MSREATARSPKEEVRERLEEHRSVLETLARTDNDLSEDAQLALELLEEGDGGE